jgi:hypothetical protein
MSSPDRQTRKPASSPARNGCRPIGTQFVPPNCAFERWKGSGVAKATFAFAPTRNQEWTMNGIIYLVGLIVVILAVLSFFGLR